MILFLRWVGPPAVGSVLVQVSGILIGGPWMGLVGLVLYTAGYLALIRWRWLPRDA